MKNETVIGGMTVGGQPTREELTSGRFGTIVNIRLPEEPGNISREALAGSDVDYQDVPYTGDTVTGEDIDRIGEIVDRAGGPVLIH